MDIESLKMLALEAIDKNRDKILSIGRKIYDNPELGYKEVNTTKLVAETFKELGFSVEENIVVTGCRARTGNYDLPRVAVIGEMDCISCKEHPNSKETGEFHGCGHNMQIAGLIGSAIGLVSSGVLEELKGNVDFIAVPAEEFIEIEYKESLRKKGKIEFFGGKQEMIRRGYFDDVNIAMMFHSLDVGENKALVGTVSNGFIGKRIRFIGKPSHAGSAPDKGVNALNAAMLAINNVHAQRETFKEEDKVRVHPIITKGGDVVNVVPSEVVMECYVRSRTVEGMMDANKKVDRALRAGAIAVGAAVEITDIPGYFPILKYDYLDNIFKNNLETLGLEGKITEQGDFTGSFDFGDLSQLMPTLHPMIGGISGSLHSTEYKIVDEELAYIISSKAMAMTVIDLLYNNSEKSQEILKSFTPPMTKEQYLSKLRDIRKNKFFE
ncbi:amidohydrolase [Haloimpatiens massiliensis]|uniref:amidohydrolase n=1 Tax=Haloimpatiens massiliensis TaxID=1658110 RepID=UPI000C81DAC6|nr:amidohydrolase [Haloimpatiens massiliensis]